MSAEGQDIEQWKQKYYDQLDRLEEKEQTWQKLETTLKRTIGRLSLAAEGQNTDLDRHLSDLRKTIKNKIDQQRLDVIVDGISQILSQLEEKQAKPDRAAVSALELLIAQLNLPASQQKAQKKLLKQITKSDDQQRDHLLSETLKLIKSVTSTSTEVNEEKQSLLDRLFHSSKSIQENNVTDVTTISSAEDTLENLADVQSISNILQHILSMIPWPDTIKGHSITVINNIRQSQTEDDLKIQILQLEQLINLWPNEVSPSDDSTDTNNYKEWLLDLLNKINQSETPDQKLNAIQLSIISTTQQSVLDNLYKQLTDFIVDSANRIQQINPDKQSNGITTDDPLLQPSIQELLIRLLEQLIVPEDLQQEAEEMKHRLEQEPCPADWKILLKDVVTLINSIRSRMQKEKHEFETFLQQVTDRLKVMDQFLQTETESLREAESQGKDFDLKIHTNVDEIKQDVQQADELSSLQLTVKTKLDTISSHIQSYRESEQTRNTQSQLQFDTMYQRMQELENETQTLRKVVVEKNKQAMFDALTGIPNRLAYEKKIEEEIARWKRFAHPLSLVVWDIDLFKKVNDTYGHKAGDKVLKTVAQLLNKRIRTTDFFARYGGEEFVMLLPGTSQEESLRLVNELRHQVEICGFHYHGDAVTITLSCGVSSFMENDTLGKVFERADKALYRAKENGRNQCVAAACLSV